jgi:hypothetical protein
VSVRALRTALRVARVPADVLDVVVLVAELAPELREAVAALVRALLGDDEKAERQAYEAARRAAFQARQRR